jgi:hypothetical protein
MKNSKKDKRLMDTTIFINRSTNVHQNKYNYDKTTYIRGNLKVIITCPNQQLII